MKITVAKPFNFSHGPETKHYAAGEHDVTQAVADHAERNGFLVSASPAAPELEAGAGRVAPAVESPTVDAKKK